MDQWSWSNILTVLIVVIVAVIEALQQALSQAPAVTKQLPAWAISPNWNYVPLVLLMVAGVIWIVDHLSTKARPFSHSTGSVPTLPATTGLPSVVHPHTSQASDRVFIDVTLEQLVAICRTYVTPQAERLIGRHIGKWLRVNGQVHDVRNYGDDWVVSIWFEYKSGPGFLVNLTFHSRWHERLEILNKDTAIHVDGRITKVEPMIVTLNECELVAE
jgi:hypothetical protein